MSWQPCPRGFIRGFVKQESHSDEAMSESHGFPLSSTLKFEEDLPFARLLESEGAQAADESVPAVDEAVANLLDDDTKLNGFSADETEVSDSDDEDLALSADDITSSDEDFAAATPMKRRGTQTPDRYVSSQGNISATDGAASSTTDGAASSTTDGTASRTTDSAASSTTDSAATPVVRLAQRSMKGRNR